MNFVFIGFLLIICGICYLFNYLQQKKIFLKENANRELLLLFLNEMFDNESSKEVSRQDGFIDVMSMVKKHSLSSLPNKENFLNNEKYILAKKLLSNPDFPLTDKIMDTFRDTLYNPTEEKFELFLELLLCNINTRKGVATNETLSFPNGSLITFVKNNDYSATNKQKKLWKSNQD